MYRNISMSPLRLELLVSLFMPSLLSYNPNLINIQQCLQHINSLARSNISTSPLNQRGCLYIFRGTKTTSAAGDVSIYVSRGDRNYPFGGAAARWRECIASSISGWGCPIRASVTLGHFDASTDIQCRFSLRSLTPGMWLGVATLD